ncbi:MAG: rRNA maturation RNase YbeY [Candidatus Andersenbacteria bacterium]|nr:rRNA maturation RNase YbeY [Candidatus Andersenbacteria bacterium]
MPVTLRCKRFPLAAGEVARLWRAVIQLREHRDEDVTVCCVSVREMTELQARYRGRPGATNVLTFSYTAEPKPEPMHDVALCMAVINREGRRHSFNRRDYAALILAHAFLHAVGLDHERSRQQALAMRQAERFVLTRCGYGYTGW